MATDPAQALAPADPIAAATAAFRTAREPDAATIARDPAGRFASVAAPEPEPVEQIEAADPDAPEAIDDAAAIDPDQTDGGEAAEEAQPEPIAMPVSWSKEDAEHWSALPPETQAVIAEREGQREAAVNSKFQEAAEARRAVEAQLTEANANRDAFAQAIGQVISLVQPVKPDPRGFQDAHAFNLAMAEYEDTMGLLGNLTQQQQAIAAQQAKEAEQAQKAAYEAVEEIARPRLLAAVPDLADPAKAGATIGEIVRYAIEQGIPESAFAPENQGNITSAEILMTWKAWQYDKLQAAKGRVAPTAKPKPAAPPMRPGVARSPTAEKSVAYQKDMARLAKSGSVEDGAAIFKHFR